MDENTEMLTISTDKCRVSQNLNSNEPFILKLHGEESKNDFNDYECYHLSLKTLKELLEQNKEKINQDFQEYNRQNDVGQDEN